MTWQIELKDADATVALGAAIAKALQVATTIFLEGTLGAGKTTLTRGIVQGLGHQGQVKSPTYTLVEPYDLGGWQVNHFDLYRLADPEELEFIGIRDYFGDHQVSIIEWPEKGEGMLGTPDLTVFLAYQQHERVAQIRTYTDVGENILNQLRTQFSS
ncbi:tRNA (adenosine(37)-N6)-threonylcarbamoyltransferase complex ATPase subunit type 1 TsaE [Celerinatantimonas sp. YJH-8]|uniref:tRNA (adenosine(37)-N6)-threonylcarbamoyltransferase complex ATPase subunit type 1 TsaE n=1 Tax=Celerinatantimonas sp. YJH-8 TaxID=3228714 RepID=UPI0038C7F641